MNQNIILITTIYIFCDIIKVFKGVRMNVIDYIKKNKDQTFAEFPFNEIDNLIFSLLTYIDFTDVVPAFKNGKITLKEAAQK